MKTRIGMILATLLLAVAPLFAADAPKACDKDHTAAACQSSECCKKDAACCKDAKSCSMKDQQSCKHAHGAEHSCSTSCNKKS